MTTGAVRSSGAESGDPNVGTRGSGDRRAVAADGSVGGLDAQAALSQLEAIVGARGAGRRSIDAPTAGATERPLVAEQPYSLVARTGSSRFVVDVQPATVSRDVNRSPARRPRGAWFYRLQGAALTCVIALGVFSALQHVDTLSPGAIAALPEAARADPSSAFADAFAQTARDEAVATPQVTASPGDGAPEAEVIARIAAADPPHRVVLHLAPEASPREVARLETAIRAWGFSQPEQQPAAGPVARPEVLFHASSDIEAATILARIAGRILPGAVLTPPPGAAAESAGRIDVYVTTR